MQKVRLLLPQLLQILEWKKKHRKASSINGKKYLDQLPQLLLEIS